MTFRDQILAFTPQIPNAVNYLCNEQEKFQKLRADLERAGAKFAVTKKECDIRALKREWMEIGATHTK